MQLIVKVPNSRINKLDWGKTVNRILIFPFLTSQPKNLLTLTWHQVKAHWNLDDPTFLSSYTSHSTITQISSLPLPTTMLGGNRNPENHPHNSQTYWIPLAMLHHPSLFTAAWASSRVIWLRLPLRLWIKLTFNRSNHNVSHCPSMPSPSATCWITAHSRHFLTCIYHYINFFRSIKEPLTQRFKNWDQRRDDDNKVLKLPNSAQKSSWKLLLMGHI